MNEDTKVFLSKLNNTLSQYIEIHDAVFTQRIGQVVDYPTLFDGLNVVSSELEIAKNFEISDTELSEAVQTYLAALYTAVLQLIHIMKNLMIKAEGGKYGFFAYRKSIKLYNELEKRRIELGNVLNSFV